AQGNQCGLGRTIGRRLGIADHARGTGQHRYPALLVRQHLFQRRLDAVQHAKQVDLEYLPGAIEIERATGYRRTIIDASGSDQYIKLAIGKGGNLRPRLRAISHVQFKKEKLWRWRGKSRGKRCLVTTANADLMAVTQVMFGQGLANAAGTTGNEHFHRTLQYSCYYRSPF